MHASCRHACCIHLVFAVNELGCLLQLELTACCVLQATTLGNWFTGLLQRHDQLGKWLTLGRPRAYWLTGFFNPQVCSNLS